jgi:hypothetical protein
MEDAVQVDGQDLPPRFDWIFPGGMDGAVDARIVDQDLNASSLGETVRESGLYGGKIRHVDGLLQQRCEPGACRLETIKPHVP